jgi:hypothetical protein
MEQKKRLPCSSEFGRNSSRRVFGRPTTERGRSRDGRNWVCGNENGTTGQRSREYGLSMQRKKEKDAKECFRRNYFGDRNGACLWSLRCFGRREKNEKEPQNVSYLSDVASVPENTLQERGLVPLSIAFYGKQNRTGTAVAAIQRRRKSEKWRTTPSLRENSFSRVRD